MLGKPACVLAFVNVPSRFGVEISKLVASNIGFFVSIVVLVYMRKSLGLEWSYLRKSLFPIIGNILFLSIVLS